MKKNSVWRNALGDTGYKFKVRKVSETKDLVDRQGYRDHLFRKALQTRPIHRSDSQILLIEHFIKQIASFSSISNEYHRDLAAEAEFRTFEEGEVLYYQGDPIASTSIVCVVIEGSFCSYFSPDFDERPDKNLSFVPWHVINGNQMKMLGDCVSTYTPGSLCGYEKDGVSIRQFGITAQERTHTLVIQWDVLDRVRRRPRFSFPSLESQILSEAEAHLLSASFSNFECLAHLSDTCQLAIARSCRIVRKKLHESLFVKTDLPQHMYWVLRGSIGLFVQYKSTMINAAGIHPAYGLHLVELATGQVFGEYGLDKVPLKDRYSLVSTDSNTSCLVLAREDYRRLQLVHHEIPRPLDSVLSHSKRNVGDILNALRRPPLSLFFNQLPTRIVSRLCEKMQLVKSNSVIYNTRDAADAMFVIVSGSVDVKTPSDVFNPYVKVNQITQMLLIPGDAFGYDEIVNSEWRKVVATGIDACLIKIPSVDFERWIKPMSQSLVFEAGSILHCLEQSLDRRQQEAGKIQRLLHNLGFFAEIPPFLLGKLILHLQLYRPKHSAAIVEEGCVKPSCLVSILTGTATLHSKEVGDETTIVREIGSSHPMCHLNFYPSVIAAKDPMYSTTRNQKYGPQIIVLGAHDVLRTSDSPSPASVIACGEDCIILRLAEQQYQKIMMTHEPPHHVPYALKLSLNESVSLEQKKPASEAKPYIIEWLKKLALPDIFDDHCNELVDGLTFQVLEPQTVISEYDTRLRGLFLLVDGTLRLYRKKIEHSSQDRFGKGTQDIASITLGRHVMSNFSKTSRHLSIVNKTQVSSTPLRRLTTAATIDEARTTADLEVDNDSNTLVCRLHPGDVYGEAIFQDKILEGNHQVVAETSGLVLHLPYRYYDELRQRLMRPQRAEDVQTQRRSAISRLKWKAAKRHVSQTIRRCTPNIMMVIQDAAAQRKELLLTQLADIALFSRMPLAVQQDLCANARYETARESDIVFSPQDPPKRMYIVLEGRVGFFTSSSSLADSNAIGHVGSGESFGEYELLQQLYSRNFYAIATEDSKLVSFPADTFKESWDDSNRQQFALLINVLIKIPGLRNIEAERLAFIYYSMTTQDYFRNNPILKPGIAYASLVVVVSGECKLQATVGLQSTLRSSSYAKGSSLSVMLDLAVVSSGECLWLEEPTKYSMVAASANVRVLFIPLTILRKTVVRSSLAVMKEEAKLSHHHHGLRVKQLRTALLTIMKDHVQMQRESRNKAGLHRQFNNQIRISKLSTTTEFPESRSIEDMVTKPEPFTLPTATTSLQGSFGASPIVEFEVNEKHEEVQRAEKPIVAPKIVTRSSIREMTETLPMQSIRLSANDTRYKGLGKMKSPREPVKPQRPMRLHKFEYRQKRVIDKSKPKREASSCNITELRVELGSPMTVRRMKSDTMTLRRFSDKKEEIESYQVYVVAVPNLIRVFKSEKHFEEGRDPLGTFPLDATVRVETSPERGSSPFDFVLTSGDRTQLWLSTKSYVEKSKWVGMILQNLIEHHTGNENDDNEQQDSIPIQYIIS